MTHSTIYAFRKGGNQPRAERRQQNGMLGAPYIWDRLCQLQFYQPPPDYRDRWQPVWDMVNNPDVPHFMRAVNTAMFDHALVLPRNFQQFVEDLREFLQVFPQDAGKAAPHLEGWAEFVHAHRRTADGIGFHPCSASENLWYGEDDGKSTWLDIADPENYFDVYAYVHECCPTTSTGNPHGN